MEEKIFITMEEYKELLIIKGKYEELKSQQPVKVKPDFNYKLYDSATTTLNNIRLCGANKQREE